MSLEIGAEIKDLYVDRDRFYWQEINDLVKENNIRLDTILKNYMAFIQRRDLPQLLAYYDLFKEVKSIPGSIVEVGVFLGNGLFTWTKLMETFYPGNRGCKVFGFDNFSGYKKNTSEIDKQAINYIYSLVGDFEIEAECVERLVKLHNLDLIIPGIERVKLYNNDLERGFAIFRKENYGVRFKLAVIDVNLYKPTKLALKNIYELMVPGGIMALRGYGVKPWEGESLAVDEFMQEYEINEIKSFEFSNYPAIYFYKSY